MNIYKAIKHYLKNTDLYLITLALACSIYGIILIYSATLTVHSIRYVLIQLAATIVGLIAFIVMSLFDLDAISGWWRIFFVLNILLQIPLFFMPETNGQRAWIPLANGAISLQPGEIGKLLFIFTFSAHLSEIHERLNEWRGICALGLHTIIMMSVIILTSKDTGMAIQYFMIALIIMFAVGLAWKWVVGGLAIGLASLPILWNFILQDYQKLRILVLFEPTLDVDTSRQTVNGQIAIGSGQMFGQGLTKGTMTQMNFVLEKRTDYIYAVAGEELGFVGSMLIIVLLVLLIGRLFYISYSSSTLFSSMLAVGIAGMFLFQTFMNIFMCIGLLPIMGLTLPLFSYGGTSVVTMYTALGIATGVGMREKPSWLQ